MMPNPLKQDPPAVLSVRNGDPPAWQLEKHMSRGKVYYYFRLQIHGRAYVLTEDLSLQAWDKLVKNKAEKTAVGKFALYDCSDDVGANDAASLRFDAKILGTRKDQFIRPDKDGATTYVKKNSNSKRLMFHFRGVNMAPVVGGSIRQF